MTDDRDPTPVPDPEDGIGTYVDDNALEEADDAG